MKTTKEKAQIGITETVRLRQVVLKECEAAGLTKKHVVKRLKESLDAFENKVFFDKDRSRCFVGPDEVAHRIRLDAAKLTTSLLDMMPAEKVDVTVNNLSELIKDARKRSTKRP
jgi:hypothetical protein